MDAQSRHIEPLERGATKHYSWVGMGLGAKPHESVEHATTQGWNKGNEKQTKRFLLHKPLAQPGASALHVAKNMHSHLSPTRRNPKLLRAESSGGCSQLHRRHKLFQTGGQFAVYTGTQWVWGILDYGDVEEVGTAEHI